MADDNRKRVKRSSTWTRSKHSCRFCSSRKQRCEFPHASSEFDDVFLKAAEAGAKLPDESKCERCRASKRDCYPTVSGPRSSTSGASTSAPRTSPGDTNESSPSSGTHDQASISKHLLPDADAFPQDEPSAFTNNLTGLLRDIPSENVSAALFPYCSGSLPRELRLSPLAILPCMCKDVGVRQRELKTFLDKHSAPFGDLHTPIEMLTRHESLQLLYDTFPGLYTDIFASSASPTPVLHRVLKYSIAFVATGTRQFLYGLADGAMMIMLACPANPYASLALTFLATYLPLEVSPIMPPAQEMNFIGFADTVNATGLLQLATASASRARLDRRNAAYLRLLGAELSRSFLYGEGLKENKVKVIEAKKGAAAIKNTKGSGIGREVLVCRLALLELSLETQDYLNGVFENQSQDCNQWELETPFPVSFTDDLRAKSRQAIGIFCCEANIDTQQRDRPILNSMNAFAARQELVLLIKAEHLSVDPLASKYGNSSWRFISEGWNQHLSSPKAHCLFQLRERKVEVARRLLIQANEAFDTRCSPTILATRETLTSIALASKSLLEVHIANLTLQRYNEDDMQADGLLLRQTAFSVAKAATILAQSLANAVDSMAKALRTWQDKLMKMAASEPQAGDLLPASPAEQQQARDYWQGLLYAQPLALQQQQELPLPPPQQQPQHQNHQQGDAQVPPGAAPPNIALAADWDGLLTEVLSFDPDWNWVSGY